MRYCFEKKSNMGGVGGYTCDAFPVMLMYAYWLLLALVLTLVPVSTFRPFALCLPLNSGSISLDPRAVCDSS